MSEVIQSYYRAMARGSEGEQELLELFALDAVYVEPFSGGTHRGRDAIGRWLAGSWESAPAGLRLNLESVASRGDVVEAFWRCDAPAFRRPARGVDRFTVNDGKIVRLETIIVEAPVLRER